MGWKLTVVLLMFSTGVSLIVFVGALLMIEQVNLVAGIALFIVTTLLIHFILFRRIAEGLSRLALALTYLHQNTPVTELALRRADPLKPLTEAVNALIRERADLKTMRGQLVEQISAAAAQEERNRLARDLHDSIKQQVFSMSISAAAAHAHLDRDPAKAKEALQDVKQSAQEAMVEMRALLQQLSPAPLEKSGLMEALREQCEALAYRTGAKVETAFEGLPGDEHLPPGTQETLFRIAQEALSNIARHARAQHVRLSLKTEADETLVLHIQDDGQGFDINGQRTGMGLNNIRSRAAGIGAEVEITSGVGSGTELCVTVPLIQEVEKESTMQYEVQLKPVIAHYYRFAGGVAVFILAVSMLVWRLLDRPEGITEDTFLMVIMAGFVIAAVVSLPTAIWSAIKARSEAAALVLSAGQNSRVDYQLRRYMRLVYIIVSIAAGWFLPILAIGLSVTPWIRVAIGVFFLGLVVWNYKRMGDFYKEELALLPAAQRAEELDARIREVRSGWWTVLILIVLVLITSLLRGEVVIPPLDPDHWMNVSFLTVAFLLLMNQIIATRTYRRWQEEAV
jgi:signal transduction histidine kinase